LPDPTLESGLDATQPREADFVPVVPDHELIRRIGGGSYGEVWLARNVVGTYRAVKVVYRRTFDHDRPYEREFAGIQKFEPVSRTHEGLVGLIRFGRRLTKGGYDGPNGERRIEEAKAAA